MPKEPENRNWITDWCESCPKAFPGIAYYRVHNGDFQHHYCSEHLADCLLDVVNGNERVVMEITKRSHGGDIRMTTTIKNEEE